MDSESKRINSARRKNNPYYFRPTIPMCLALMGGILVGDWLPGGEIWALGVALCGVALILRRISIERPAGKIPLGLLFALGYFSLQPYVAPILPSNHVINFPSDVTYKITGWVESVSKVKNGQQKLKLTVNSLATDGSIVKAAGNLQLTVFGEDPLLAIGDHIQFYGRIKKIRNFYNPGGFDYERHMAFQGIRARSYCQIEDLVRLSDPDSSTLLWGLGQSRSEIAMVIEKAAIDRPDTQAVLAALLLGRKELISQTLREVFNRCGIGHLLAISGLHVGIVALLGFWLFNKCFAFVPTLLWRGVGQRLAAVIALIPVIYYGWLASFSPATQRAVLMVAVVLGTYLVGRRGDIYNTLAWAAVVILILHPPTLFSISFQLSFAAVLTIVIGTRRLKNPLRKYKNSVGGWIAWWVVQATLVSLLALLGTLPLTMHYFNQISFVGPLANLAFIPLLGFIAVPIGLLAIFINPLSSYLSMFLLKISAEVVNYSIHLIELIADVPWASLRTFTPSVVEIILYFLFGLVLLERKRLMVRKFAVWTVLFLIIVDVFFWVHIRFFDHRLRVTSLDVGQGSATLVELPEGKTILVDGGGFSDNSSFDVGARILAPFLWRKKILTLNLAVLTHPNSDHLNGLLYILDNFRVQKVITNNEKVDTLGYRKFEELLGKRHIVHPRFSAIDKHFQMGRATVDIFYPPDDYSCRKTTEHWRESSNNNSIVMKLSLDGKSLLFTGDLMAPAEKALVASYGAEQLNSTVVMVPHHGSKSSSQITLVQAIKPKVAVISAGWQNPFGFPSQEILNRYETIGARILRTDLCGAVRLVMESGQSVSVKTTLPCQTL